MSQKIFQNPIMPGFYPDPSMCRVGDDYYLVTSTFSYFPGVPIFHSTDLVHWEQIGNVLDRREQLELMGAEMSQGIFAPTIRYHDGTFYMITTNVSSNGNFLVTATNPAGPWSNPYNLGSAGIDPSLFFDDDGKCYYCGTQERREGARYFGDNEIYIQELDLNTMKLVGESYPAWHGALRNVVWPEGPHLYKKDGWYYLLISEAGTAHEHAISIARSKSLFKPFEGHKGNPIMTHRHLGYEYPIVNVGHPDIVETQNGEWWMVLLASRPYGGYFRNLGRETFLVPFIWENGWPVVNPGKGIVENEGIAPNLPEQFVAPTKEKEDFDRDTLPLHFMYLRNPQMENYSLRERPGYLRMKLAKETITERLSPSFVCIRQQHMRFIAETSLDFSPQNSSEAAGLVINQSQDANLQLLVGTDDQVTILQVIRVENGKMTILKTASLDKFYSKIALRITADGQNLTLSYLLEDNEKLLLSGIDARFLSTDRAGGFVGNTIGIYCSSNGQESHTVCDFDYLLYKEKTNCK